MKGIIKLVKYIPNVKYQQQERDATLEQKET